jgi:hypothetical protein
MRQLDSEIMTEEARIGDFKRRATKNFMALKLGGLLEFAEKATVCTSFVEFPSTEQYLDRRGVRQAHDRGAHCNYTTPLLYLTSSLGNPNATNYAR